MIGEHGVHGHNDMHAGPALGGAHDLGTHGMGGMGNGTLVVRIIEARLTHNTELITKMDPYVFMKHRDVQQRTSVRKRAGKHPVWDQTFRFHIHSPHDEIEFFVMDKDTFTKDDVIGWVTLSAQRLLEVAGHPQIYQLQYKKGFAGDLELEAHFDGGHINTPQVYDTHAATGVVYPTGATQAYHEHDKHGHKHDKHHDKHGHKHDKHMHGETVYTEGTYIGDTRHLDNHPHQQVHMIEKVTTYTGADAQHIINEAQHNPTALLEPTLLNEQMHGGHAAPLAMDHGRGDAYMYGAHGEAYGGHGHAHAGHVEPGVYTGSQGIGYAHQDNLHATGHINAPGHQL